MTQAEIDKRLAKLSERLTRLDELRVAGIQLTGGLEIDDRPGFGAYAEDDPELHEQIRREGIERYGDADTFDE